jgi:hypothetical protein
MFRSSFRAFLVLLLLLIGVSDAGLQSGLMSIHSTHFSNCKILDTGAGQLAKLYW